MNQDVNTQRSSPAKAAAKLSKLAGKQPKEGELTKKVETLTAQIPSMGYLTLAMGSMAASAALAVFSKRKTIANFVGLWVPTFLLFGIYNKIVKVEGSDQQSHQLH